MKITRLVILSAIPVIILAASANIDANATPLSPITAAAQPNIGVNGYFSMDRAPRGRTIQAAVVLNIPGGYHVNSNRPSAKYLIATSLKIDAPGGIKIGGIRYPPARMRSFGFSNQKLSVFEGRAVMRFSVAVPANFAPGKIELKARVRYQSCSDKECYAPASKAVSMWIDVVNTNESAKRANGNIF